MSGIKDKYNPFIHTIYDELNVDPYCSTDELEMNLDILVERFEELSKVEQDEQMADFQNTLQLLKTPRLRILLNALILDKVNVKYILNILGSLQETELSDGNYRMPNQGLEQLLIEGESLELANSDFEDIESISELEINFQEIKTVLHQIPETRYFVFDS